MFIYLFVFLIKNLWIAVFDPNPLTEGYYHVLGPVFTDALSTQLLQQRVNSYLKLTLNWKQKFIHIVQQFPVVPWQTLAQYTVMLHFAVTGEHITVSDFSYQRAPASSASASSGEVKKKTCHAVLNRHFLIIFVKAI